jgi:hypothetical protein
MFTLLAGALAFFLGITFPIFGGGFISYFVWLLIIVAVASVFWFRKAAPGSRDWWV